MKPIMISDMKPMYRYDIGDIVDIIYSPTHKLIGLSGKVFNRVDGFYYIALFDGKFCVASERNVMLSEYST